MEQVRGLMSTENGPTNGKSVSTICMKVINNSDTSKNNNVGKPMSDNNVEKGMNGLKKEETSQYDPFANRDPIHATSDAGALIHMLKSSLGSGILAIPIAFKSSGTVVGVLGTIFIGFVCTHCVAMLVRCSQKLSARVQKPSLGFAETAEVAFKTGPEPCKRLSKVAREFVNISLFSTYYLGNTVYIVLISLTVKQLMEYHADVDIGIRWYILLVAVPLLPLGIGRRLKFLVPFSALGTAFILFGLLVTLYYILSDVQSWKAQKMVGSFGEMPVFVSTVLFAMEGIGTVLPIENSMKHPQHFLGTCGILNIAMTIIVILYGSVGLLGYIQYGDQIQGSITLNLPRDLLGESVKIMVGLSILFSYGLQFCVPSEIVWKHVQPLVNPKHEDAAYYIMRGSMIIGTVAIAIVIPNLAPIISLVGALCFSILGLLTPAMIDTITDWNDGINAARVFKNVCISLFALVALVTGAYCSILEMIGEPDRSHPN